MSQIKKKKQMNFEQYLINNNIKYKLEIDRDILVDDKDLIPYELDIKKHYPHFMLKQEHDRYNTIPHNVEHETEECLD